MPTKTKPKYWQKAVDYLSQKDKKMAKIIAASPGKILGSLGQPYFTLARAIIGQQISVKAADSIWARFEDSLGTIEAKNVLKKDDEELRALGLSRQKVLYLKNIASYFIEKKITKEYFSKTDPEIIAKELLAIKGVGKWTVQMFQFFYMLEPDILPLTDLGLIRAVQNHYANGEKLSQEDIIKISDKWKPYRTVATWYLWRTIDPNVVAY